MPDVTLRPVTLKDCTQRYVDWLNDPEVNRWLETRWQTQTLSSIKLFVEQQLPPERHLLAICVDGNHIGNLKIGPVHPIHNYADISYFIGERSEWRKGYATKAVRLACEFAFHELRLHRLQAGAYLRNQASHRVLRRAGFSNEGIMRRQLKTENGWEDHVFFGRCADAVAM